MTTKDLKIENNICIADIISNYEFEISEMQKILDLINSNKWNEVDFCLNLNNPALWKEIITKFDFKDCIPEKYIIAIKKLVKMGFEEGIQNKKLTLNELKKFS